MRWIGLAVILFALLMLLLFQESINGWLNANSNNSAIDDMTVVIEEEMELPLVVTAAQAERNELADLIAAIPDTNKLEVQAVESIDVEQWRVKIHQPIAETSNEIVANAPAFLKKEWVMAL